MLSFIPTNDTYKEDKLKFGKMNFLANWPKMIENNETFLDVAQVLYCLSKTFLQILFCGDKLFIL